MKRPSDTPPPVRLLLRPQEASDALGVSLRTVMEWVRAGDIPVVRLGERNLRFPLDALRDWVAQRTSWPTAIVVPGDPEQSVADTRKSVASGNGVANEMGRP